MVFHGPVSYYSKMYNFLRAGNFSAIHSAEKLSQKCQKYIVQQERNLSAILEQFAPLGNRAEFGYRI